MQRFSHTEACCDRLHANVSATAVQYVLIMPVHLYSGVRRGAREFKYNNRELIVEPTTGIFKKKKSDF